MPKFRVGDVVKHIPTGETWIVTATKGDDLIPGGWPESVAKEADCVMISPASNADHRYWLRETLQSQDNNMRARWAEQNLIEASPIPMQAILIVYANDITHYQKKVYAAQEAYRNQLKAMLAECPTEPEKPFRDRMAEAGEPDPGAGGSHAD